MHPRFFYYPTLKGKNNCKFLLISVGLGLTKSGGGRIASWLCLVIEELTENLVIGNFGKINLSPLPMSLNSRFSPLKDSQNICLFICFEENFWI